MRVTQWIEPLTRDALTVHRPTPPPGRCATCPIYGCLSCPHTPAARELRRARIRRILGWDNDIEIRVAELPDPIYPPRRS